MAEQRIGFLYLAGGNSRRMGSYKSQLEYNSTTLLKRALMDVAQSYTPEASNDERNANSSTYSSCVVSVPPALQSVAKDSAASILGSLEYTVQADSDQLGPLSGLMHAEAIFRKARVNKVFVFACDTLILPSKMLKVFLGADLPTCDNDKSYYLSLEQSVFPLFGLYTLNALSLAEQRVKRGELRVMEWLCELNAEPVEAPVQWESSIQFNTPEEFQKACLHTP